MAEATFQEIKPPLTNDAAVAEANRCLFCYDAPCTRACPTHIDVPGFIKKIVSGNLRGSARTILDANILGASCARVCPTEVLCEGACVLHDLHQKPIKIGQLQRHSTDWAMARGISPIDLIGGAAKTKRNGKVAIIGAGPAGLACAAELLKQGVAAVVYDANNEPGGLNTFGVAEYKMTPDFARKEVQWVINAGLTVKSGVRIGKDVSLAELEKQHDAIFLGIGLGKVHKLGIPGEDLPGVYDAVEFIATLKTNRPALKMGKRVAVIGGGNTSIDAVTQSAGLGAEEVTLVYRRSPEEMPAYKHEVLLAKEYGIRFAYLSQPTRVIGNGKVEGLECERMKLGQPDASGRRRPEKTGEKFTLTVDTVIAATGQQPQSEFLKSLPNVRLEEGCVVVDERTMQTSNPKYFAGGDCISGGKEVVNAVAEGKKAALGIVAFIDAKNGDAKNGGGK